MSSRPSSPKKTEVEYYAYGGNKAKAIVALAKERGYDLLDSYAYSDSETDIPMLEVVGHPFAVNPDKTLRRHAGEQGWPVLVFARPVALRPRLGLDTRAGKIAAASAIATGVGALTVALLARRRHRLAS